MEKGQGEIQEEMKTFLMFIGTPRSGHTLTASMINSHKNAFLSNQYNFLQNIFDLDKDAIINRIKSRPKNAFAKIGIHVAPKEKLSIIGDKTGHMNAWNILNNINTIDEFNKTIGIPVKWIHVTRNPFDNISTWVKKNRQNHIKHGRNNMVEQVFPTVLKKYSDIQGVIENVKEREEVLTIYHEQQVTDTEKVLNDICSFLDLEVYDGFISNIKSKLWNNPRQTRKDIEWNKENKEEVYKLIERYSWLRKYNDKGNKR